MERCKGILRALGLLLSVASVAAWGQGQPAEEGSRPVRAASFDSLAQYPQRQAPAQVLSLNDSRIEAEIAAVVESNAVRVGDRVALGEVLLELDCADTRDALEQARAAHRALAARRDFADFQLKRARSLVKGGNISDEQLHQREAEARALAAELDSAKSAEARAARDRDRCSIKAPFDAVVMERLIGVGEKAAPGKPLLHLLDVGALEVSAQVQASDEASLQGAETFELMLGERRYPLTLRSLLPALEPLSRSREARLEFALAAEESAASPGASGRLLWRSARPHLPAEYLLRRKGRYGVFLLRDGQAQFHLIEGAREGSAAPLALPGETLIITEGRYTLRHGDRVRRVE